MPQMKHLVYKNKKQNRKGISMHSSGERKTTDSRLNWGQGKLLFLFNALDYWSFTHSPTFLADDAVPSGYETGGSSVSGMGGCSIQGISAQGW